MTSSNISTPLATLLAMLKSEDFDISTSTLIDLQKILANLGDEQLSSFSELRSLISPLVSRNKEEQEHFNAVFTRYEDYIKANSFATYEESKAIVNVKKRHRYIPLIVAGILALAAIAYFLFVPKAKLSPSISVLTISKDSLDYSLIGEPVSFLATLKDTVLSQAYHVDFKIDDTVYHNARELEKIFYSQGEKSFRAYMINERNDTLNFYSNNITVYCEKQPAVSIIKDSTSKPSKKHYALQFANAKDTSGFKYKWFINDSLAGETRDLSATIKPGKAYVIKAIVDTKSAFKCIDSLTASFNERPAYNLSVTGMKPLNVAADTNWNKIIIAGLYSMLLPLSLAAFILFYKRNKNKLKLKDIPPPAETIEYTGPYKIEFKDQAEKISPEKEISQLAEAMRKRHVSDQLFLNVSKTIASTIRSGGFPYLQFSSRTQPTDFLVFIDKQNPDGLQVKLFEFVLKKLEAEQVNIISYAFYREPLLLSNDKLNQRMLPVGKVAMLYPNTILFIFSDTREFFETLSTKLKPWVTDKFRAWDHKIIVTPVPVDDWDYKENTLSKEGFTVVPADLNAHHLIANEINNLINRQKIQFAVIPASYSSRFVNFDDWAQVKKYIGNDDKLMQWVAALAVYPYIDWKATVAIGKALEEKNVLNTKLVTYTNLLKLSRIRWMQTGLIPDSLRLEMLADLDNDSEVVARNVMLQLLHEVEENITATSMIADEFELNKTVNRFLLHARNPAEHPLTAEEHEKMKSYVDNQWLDQPLEQYLDRADNTLLKDATGSKSLSPSEYFKTEDIAETKKINKERSIRRVLAAAVLLAGIFLAYNFFKNADHYKIPKQYADITFNLVKNNLINGFKKANFSVIANDKTYAGDIISDSAVIVKNLPVDTTQQIMINLEGDSIYNFEQSLLLNSQEYTISIIPPRQPSPIYIRYNDAASYTAIDQQLQNAFADFDISASQANFSDSSRIVYYEANQKARADSVIKIIKDNLGMNVNAELKADESQFPPVLYLNLSNNQCRTITALPALLNEIWSGGTNNRLINILPAKKLIYYSTGDKKTYGTYRIEEICLNTSGMYRIITNTDNGYQDFFIKNAQPSSFELSICQNRYNSLQEARAVNESYCDHFNEMKFYYENDNAKAFLSQQGKLQVGQIDKLKKVVYVRNANMILFKILLLNNSFNSSATTLGSIKALLSTSLGNARITYTGSKFRGTPFDRDYISIDNKTMLERNAISIPPGATTATKVEILIANRLGLKQLDVTSRASLTNDLGADDLDRTELIMEFEKEFNISITEQQFSSITTVDQAIKLIESLVSGTNDTVSKEILLKKITLGAKGYPDADGQAVLKQIVEYMSSYSKTNIRIVLYYTDDYSQKEAQSFQNTIQNYLTQFKYNRAQVKFEFGKNAVQQQQQQNAPLSKSGGYNAAPQYADVYGTGFPQGFSSKLQSKASAY